MNTENGEPDDLSNSTDIELVERSYLEHSIEIVKKQVEAAILKGIETEHWIIDSNIKRDNIPQRSAYARFWDVKHDYIDKDETVYDYIVSVFNGKRKNKFYIGSSVSSVYVQSSSFVLEFSRNYKHSEIDYKKVQLWKPLMSNLEEITSLVPVIEKQYSLNFTQFRDTTYDIDFVDRLKTLKNDIRITFKR